MPKKEIYDKDIKKSRNKTKKWHRENRKKFIEAKGNKCFLCPYSGEYLQGHNLKGEEHGHYYGIKERSDPNFILLCNVCHRALNRTKYWKRIKVFEKAMKLLEKPKSL